MGRDEDIARAKAVADAIRDAWPEKAAEIDGALNSGLSVKVRLSYKLEKFDGGSVAPFESVEGEI